ncbi:uncharacterized protein LOC135345473 [Halichondria panicea]|uniref:uncharacterized protein LOC135345473 n=1 Tax=Halichondria panicea TaxID=6063 RepID=UPI00312B4260
MLSICNVDIRDLLSYVKDTVSGEKHLVVSVARQEFWKCLQTSETLVSELLRTLASLFGLLYKNCDKGKDKYMKFQLEWHQCCSVFLLPPGKNLSDVGIDSKKKVELAHFQQRWIGYCDGSCADKHTRDAVMISVCSAVYNYLLKRVSQVQQSLLMEPTSSGILKGDVDSVYYRFCGAALASMLQSCKNDQRETINQEIEVLRCIQCTDKDHIPGKLKYRDRGHMYFPSKDFLTVLRGIDSCVMENANESTLRKYGPDMIDVAVKQDDTVDVLTFDLAIKVVYKELCRKLCHTRLGEYKDEYISATQQNLAALKGKSTLAGQNLRDELLTSHVNTKSFICMLGRNRGISR